MLNINYLFFYSLMGFIMESVVYKIGDHNRHSGIFYGPYTLVYGFGVLSSILIYEYLEKRLKNKSKRIKIFLYFIIFTIVLTLIEYMGGNILNLIFSVDLWDYSNHLLNFGKYICLQNAIVWGILGTINIYYIYPKIKNYFKKLPHFYTIIILLIFSIDFFITIYTKIILK